MAVGPQEKGPLPWGEGPGRRAYKKVHFLHPLAFDSVANCYLQFLAEGLRQASVPETISVARLDSLLPWKTGSDLSSGQVLAGSLLSQGQEYMHWLSATGQGGDMQAVPKKEAAGGAGRSHRGGRLGSRAKQQKQKQETA
jgi:hypothetical protein